MPIAVDHLDADEVQALAERLRAEYGAIDVLVNDIWGAEVLKGGPPVWNTPIWELDLDTGLRIVRLGVETHLVTSHHLLPLMVQRPGGLLIEVTDGTATYNADHYRISVFYDLVKTTVTRLAYSTGHDLAPFGGTAVAITPGFLRSEMMLDNFGVTEADVARRRAAPPGLRRVRDAALRRPGRRRPRRRPRAGPVEPALDVVGRARHGVRLHRRRRLATRRLGASTPPSRPVRTLTPPTTAEQARSVSPDKSPGT